LSANYDRLSMEDAMFLIGEKPDTPMHVGALLILERGPLGTEDGGISIDAFRKGVGDREFNEGFRTRRQDTVRQIARLSWKYVPIRG